MKQTVFIILTAIVGFVIGFVIGKSNGYTERHTEQVSKSYSELVFELRQKELVTINDFVHVTSKMKTIDEGGLFKVKNVSYLLGTIENHALATGIKDIKLKVNYLSGTKAVISSEEITVYDLISPSRSKDFKEKVNVPDKTQSFSFSVVDLRTE